MAKPIDVDDSTTWPNEVSTLVNQWADHCCGTTEYTGDLPLDDDAEGQLLNAFGGRPLRARHCTRLLQHEVQMIRVRGLRPLSLELIRDRIDNAHRASCISADDAENLHAAHVFATGEQRHREGQICLVVSRRIFQHDLHGCLPLLVTWGGEAIYRSSGEMPEHLKEIGVPTVVVSLLDIDGPHSFYSSLPKVFVGAALGLDDAYADVFYRSPIPPSRIEDILQPGNLEYDQLGSMPT